MQLWCWKLARWSSTRTFGAGAWDEPCRLLGGAAKHSTYHVSSAENHVFCMSWMLWNTHEYTRIWMNMMETEWNMMDNARLWWKHFGFPCVCNSHEAHGKRTSVENQSCLTMYLNNKTMHSSISPGLLWPHRPDPIHIEKRCPPSSSHQSPSWHWWNPCRILWILSGHQLPIWR